MDIKQIKQRMDEGRIYPPGDKELLSEQLERLEMLYDYNATRPSQTEQRTQMLKKMFRSIGSGCYIEPPLAANWAGKNVTFGDNVYANFHLTLVDDGVITVGDNVMFGPNVTIVTAGHPVEPKLRAKAAQFNICVTIGNNVWIGANAVILPGISIGSNTVVGAGAVVTKNLPDNVVAVGNPARILRPIGDKDREYYFKDRKIDITAEEF